MREQPTKMIIHKAEPSLRMAVLSRRIGCCYTSATFSDKVLSPCCKAFRLRGTSETLKGSLLAYAGSLPSGEGRRPVGLRYPIGEGKKRNASRDDRKQLSCGTLVRLCVLSSITPNGGCSMALRF